MESKKMKFRINNYVLYKAQNEWHEGRITNISYEDSVEIYHLRSFHNFNNMIFKSEELLVNATPENKRKMKTSIFYGLAGKIHIPPLLKSMLVIDKDWVQNNIYQLPAKHTVSNILKQAKDFFINNGAGDQDEISEIYNGFVRVFDSFLPRVLLYETEIEQYHQVTESPSEKYGSVYLLRLIYFLQKQNKSYIDDPVTAGIMLDYTIYLLDFLMMKFKELF